MNAIEQVVRAPCAAVEFTNIILTTPDAPIGRSPSEVIWTHTGRTLYRYRSSAREHAIPVWLVFALINRPEIFDLRRGNSLVEFPLDEGFDVFLVDSGAPGDEDADMGLVEDVCDESHWAVRETLRSAGREELTLVVSCIGGTVGAMYCALHPNGPVRDAILLTTPIDPSDSLYARWLGGEECNVDLIADSYPALPGSGINWSNKLMKRVANHLTTCRRLLMSVLGGEAVRVGYQAMAKWVADNPPFASRAYREWVTWRYRRTVSSMADCGCVGSGSICGPSSGTCLSLPPAPITSHRGKAPFLAAISSRGRTSLTSPGPEVKSG
jgi:polyhydroxyalkanoate synthase